MFVCYAPLYTATRAEAVLGIFEVQLNRDMRVLYNVSAVALPTGFCSYMQFHRHQ